MRSITFVTVQKMLSALEYNIQIITLADNTKVIYFRMGVEKYNIGCIVIYKVQYSQYCTFQFPYMGKHYIHNFSKISLV